MRGFGKRGKAPGNRQRQRLLHFAAGGALSKNLAKIVSTRAFNCAREISKRVLKPVPHLWEVAKLMERQTIGFFSPQAALFPRLTSITTVLSTDMTSLRSLKS